MIEDDKSVSMARDNGLKRVAFELLANYVTWSSKAELSARTHALSLTWLVKFV